jgi:hypothetical protein
LVLGRQGLTLLLQLLRGSILAKPGVIYLKCKPTDRLLLLLQQGIPDKPWASPAHLNIPMLTCACRKAALLAAHTCNTATSVTASCCEAGMQPANGPSHAPHPQAACRQRRRCCARPNQAIA